MLSILSLFGAYSQARESLGTTVSLHAFSVAFIHTCSLLLCTHAKTPFLITTYLSGIHKLAY